MSGTFCDHFSPSWGQFGVIFSHLGAVFGHLEAILEETRAILAFKLATKWLKMAPGALLGSSHRSAKGSADR